MDGPGHGTVKSAHIRLKANELVAAEKAKVSAGGWTERRQSLVEENRLKADNTKRGSDEWQLANEVLNLVRSPDPLHD